MIIDTHTHIYHKEFSGDLPQVMDRARQAGVGKFYLPGIDSTFIDNMLAVEAAYPGVCFAMTGLHPTSVDTDYRKEVDLIESWLSRRSFPAVGEIGLDFYWDRTHEVQQYEAFRAQIELALAHNRPIVIHTRNAMKETIAVVKEYIPRGLRGIFHCFGDTLESATEIINMGFYLGIGGVLTYKNSGLPAVLEKIDLAHLVLETDAPYLTPVPHRGKRNEPSYLPIVAQRLADVKQVSLETIADITTTNAEKIFAA
jgi:TatD DNase family protein